MSRPSPTMPDSLLHLCVRYCANNTETFTRSLLSNLTDEVKTEGRAVQNSSGMSAFPTDLSTMIYAYLRRFLQISRSNQMKTEGRAAQNSSGMSVFPTNLSNMIFAYIGRYLRTNRNKAEFIELMSLFGDPNKTPLRQLSLQQEHELSTSIPQSIFNQPLQYLDLCCCRFYHHYNHTNTVFDKMCSSLNTLRISYELQCKQSMCHEDISKTEMTKGFPQSHKDGNTINSAPTAANEVDVSSVKLYKFPALTRFVVNVVPLETQDGDSIRRFFARVICASFTNLTHLQLIGLAFREDELGFLEHVPKLTSLGLSGHRIKNKLGTGLRQIAKAKNLRHLDLSRVDEHPYLYDNPDESMSELLESLPSLTSLDVSGTNLAGSKVKHPREEKSISRVFGNRTFSFLGLCNCAELPFSWENVPAEQFTCFEIFENLVLALDVYKENSWLVLCVLYSLQSYTKETTAEEAYMTKRKVALDRKTPQLIGSLLRIIHLHPSMLDVQTTCCSCISELLVRDMPSVISVRGSLGQALRARLLETTIYCLNNASDKKTLRHCLNIFFKLKLPDDAKYCHSLKRFIKSVLDIFCKPEKNVLFCNSGKTFSFNHSFETDAIRLMKKILDYGDHEANEILGQEGFLEFLLSVARRKNTKPTRLVWQCLWGVTDDEPPNCRRFMALPDILQFLVECMKVSVTKSYSLVSQTKKDASSYLRCQLGILVNVSGISELRKDLLQNEELIVIIRDLIDSKEMESVINFQAACIMACLVSDGPEAWILDNLDRSSVLCKIANAVRCWGISCDMDTWYRTLQPFLELAQSETPEAQLLGVWSICNLLKTEGKVYCQMLKVDGGLSIIEAIKNDPKRTPEVLELAVMTMDLVSSFYSSPSVNLKGCYWSIFEPATYYKANDSELHD